LTVTVKNAGDQPVAVLSQLVRHRIRILLAADGGEYRRFQYGNGPSGKVAPESVPLTPGDVLRYEFRVLYTFYAKESENRRSGLAIEQPGNYSIKVQYPVPRGGEVLESNVVEFSVAAPQGDDAKLWSEIQTPAFLCFLQYGDALRNDVVSPRRAMEMLRAHPESGYAAGLKSALRQYYARSFGKEGTWEEDGNEELVRDRRLLGMPVARDNVFPQDRRLDTRVRCDFPEYTPLADVFDELSQQANVPLHLATELQHRRFTCSPHTLSLRQFMDNCRMRNATWVREADGGYHLIPIAVPPRAK
jgi:hypothetical protein